MDAINAFLETVDKYIWGVPLMVLIISGGLLLTIRTRGIQITRLPLAIKWIFAKEDSNDSKGEVSSFGSLMTALSATVGTGNIVGVATAITLGGPGALFWMVITATIGMATKYAEGFLAIRYRSFDSEGNALGGPFMYIEKGMGKKWRWLAKVFAFFGTGVALFGIGTATQVNGINAALNNFFNTTNESDVTIPFLGSYSYITIIASIIIAVLVAIIIFGGIKRITSFASVIVPFMAIGYFVMGLLIIILNIDRLPDAVVTIVGAAFNPEAFTGGVVGSFFIALRTGMARGIFSNEAGLGSAPIAAAAAKTNQPVRQGLISMTGTFIDTIIICSITGLSIVITGAWQVDGLEGVAITTYAFQNGLPFNNDVTAFMLMLALTLFAFTSIVGWNYYGERCIMYLTNDKPIVKFIYRIAYILAVFSGSYLTVSAVWTIADIFNGLMAIPNMVALFALSGVIAGETKQFFQEMKKKKEAN